MKYFTIAAFAVMSVPFFANAATEPVIILTPNAVGSVSVYATVGNSSTTVVMTASSTGTTGCPLLTDFLKKGGSNNPAQVTKLQTFLRDGEKLNVTVNGIFDDQTEAAVKAFQVKYTSDIMGPWGGTKASGFVHITTLKKINQLACKQALSLDKSELQTINEFKGRGSSSVTVTASVNSNSTVGPTIQTSSETTEDSSVSASTTSSEDSNDDSDQSSYSGDSMMNKFGHYLVNLFR